MIVGEVLQEHGEEFDIESGCHLLEQVMGAQRHVMAFSKVMLFTC